MKLFVTLIKKKKKNIYIYIYETCELIEAIHNNRPCKISLFFSRGGIGMGLGSLGSIGESSTTCTNLSIPIELTIRELDVSVYYIILENISLFYTT